MKPMLDKDFDKVFKSSFEGFEVTPAADSWDKISKKLDNKSNKKFPVFWMAAASVVIVLGIGIGLYTKPTEVIKLKSNNQVEMMSNLAKEQPTITSNTEVDNEVGNAPVYKEKTIAKSTPEIKNEEILNPLKTKSTAKDETVTSTQVEDLSNIEETAKTVKPIRTKLVTEQIIEQEQNNLQVKNPVSFAQTKPEKTEKENQGILGKKLKISTVGDIVNFVVAKVDKREEKIIKVSKTEESDNEVTGINLGLFRFIKAE